jgi:DNA-binding response OmpR family regulator
MDNSLHEKSPKARLLVVDDDRHIAELISLYLRKEGYETKEVYNGRDAVEVFSAYAPLLVLLDLMLPEMDGYEVCREIRRVSSVPVIMLSARGETYDKVKGLELGADDYMVKPFEPKELVARVKAVLRRYEDKTAKRRMVTMPNLTVDADRLTAVYHGQQLELPPKEFELLLYLSSNPGQPFTRDHLLNVCWGYEFAGDTRTVDVHVKRLREKMRHDDPWAIKTVWGTGYKFEVSDEP